MANKLDFADNECIYCYKQFTEDNPCVNDDGCTEDGKLHVDGECKACSELRNSCARCGNRFNCRCGRCSRLSSPCCGRCCGNPGCETCS